MFKVIVLLFVVALCLADYVKVDPDDEDVKVAANVAAKALSKQFSGKYHHRLAKIVKANKAKQEERYDNFIMDLIVGMTSCTKEEYTYEDLETADCDFKSGKSVFKKCTVVVFGNAQGEQSLVASGCILAEKKDLEGI